MSTRKQEINDYHTLYRYNNGSDIKLSNAQRLLGVDLTVEEVVTAYKKVKNKTRVLMNAGLSHKTFYRWSSGESEPMYHKLADLYEYIKEDLDGINR
jgi:hypothetical protein